MKTITFNQRGVALVISLLVILILVGLSTIFVTKAVFEKNMMDREIRSAKAIYASFAGGNAGLNALNTLINTNLLGTVNVTNPSTVASQAATYVSTNNSIGFLYNYTKSGASYLFTTVGTTELDYSGNATIDNGTYTYLIKVTAKGNPVTVNATTWDFPYYYAIQTTGANGNQTKRYTTYGDFTVRVQKDDFARYALFTNSQTMSTGTAVWFTSATNFTGPLYTNGQYNFAYNPGPTFYGSVSQVNANANFYNNNHPVSLNADHNGTTDVPSFQAGFTRSATAVTMPASSVESSMVTEATNGGTYATNGVYVPNSSGHTTGGIYVKGDASVSLSVDASSRQVYSITVGGNTTTVTVDTSTNQTIVHAPSGTNTTYSGKPNGVDGVGTLLYVNGNITNIGGTVASATQATIASHNDTIIQNNILYTDYTAASGTPGSPGYVAPSASGYTNLLGLVSWTGDVRIGTSAPNNVTIHGTVMAPAGDFEVDNYSTTPVRGTATVLGGVITDTYGPFGTFNSGTGNFVSGYGRNFVYDARMQTQYSPPYFPTMSTFIAYTNDINDKKFWQVN